MRLGWKLPLERLSASSLGTAIQCPEMFRQKYILRTRETNFDSRFIGSVAHDMARTMAQAKINGEELEDPEIDVLYRRSWDEILDKDGEPAWIKLEAPKAYEIGVKMAKLHYKDVISTSTYQPVAVEQRVEFKINGLPAKVIGYPDVVCASEEGHVIREIKTADKKTTVPKPKWRFQGLIYQYALGLPTQWDIVTRQVTPQIYLASEHESLFLPVQKPDFIRQMIVDTAWRLNDLYNQYGSDSPWPTTGIFGDWLCNYCPIGPRHAGTCPAWDTQNLFKEHR